MDIFIYSEKGNSKQNLEAWERQGRGLFLPSLMNYSSLKIQLVCEAFPDNELLVKESKAPLSNSLRASLKKKYELLISLLNNAETLFT